MFDDVTLFSNYKKNMNQDFQIYLRHKRAFI